MSDSLGYRILGNLMVWGTVLVAPLVGYHPSDDLRYMTITVGCMCICTASVLSAIENSRK